MAFKHFGEKSAQVSYNFLYYIVVLSAYHNFFFFLPVDPFV